LAYLLFVSLGAVIGMAAARLLAPRVRNRLERIGSPESLGDVPIPANPTLALISLLLRKPPHRAPASPPRNEEEVERLAQRIDRILPQTQCTRCGYPACLPYARAIAAGEADIDQCPPGGEAGVRALATLLGREPKPLNPEHGQEKPPEVALIREAECIGCTKCIQACPVDAIVGASKLMHVVLADRCTGCELCVPPCPVDCIDMVPAPWAA